MQKDFANRLTSIDFEISPTFRPLPIRADLYLKRKLTKRSRNQLQKVFEAGRVLVNNRAVPSSHKLRGGETIRVMLDPDMAYISPDDMELDIIHEDDDLLVINKAAGVMVHPAGSVLYGTLLNKVHKMFEERGVDTRPGVLQRLDKDTSGLMLWAKNHEAHVGLQKQFRKHSIAKIYIALCEGVPEKSEAVLDGSIGEVSHPFQKKMGVYEGEGSKTAVTRYTVLAAGADMALVGIRLYTGRQHQIRVHFQHMGHPLVGDQLYGGSGRMSRQALHSYHARISHPSGGLETDFCAPLPADFQDLLESMPRSPAGAALNMDNLVRPWDPRAWILSSHMAIADDEL